jgi:23S rRNA pseudouridine1911/1915/1917 synthase
VKPVGGALAVVFEDEHLVVIDKPAGIAVHPGSGHIDDTLVNHLVARYPAMASVGEPDRPGVVHRLDRDTSGLLVFALTAAAYEALVAALKIRSVSRTYTALVHGQPSPDAGVIDAPVGRDPTNRTRQAVVVGGKDARTRYRALRSVGPWSLLEVNLETGRMHQVRVHLAAAGYPVAGDPTYGRAPRIVGLDRQFLHAARLKFAHPVSGGLLEFESPLPDDLRGVLEQLEGSK